MNNAVAVPTGNLPLQGLHLLLVYTFAMILGFSMLMPLVAVHFVNDVGMTATLVGLALAIRQLTQQGLTIVGGVLADRFGVRLMICAGVLVRALGFACLALADNSWLLFIALVIAALGGALFEAPYQAAIVALTRSDNRAHYYVVSNLVGGIASTLGPLLGVWLLHFNFQWVCLIAASCFLLNFVIAAGFFPTVHQPLQQSRPAANLLQVFHHKRFVFFTCVMTGYWFASMQINISFPLWAEHLTGDQQSVGYMYALCAALTLALQYPLGKLAERWLDTRRILIAGIVIISLGCTAIAWVTSFAVFMCWVAIFQLGVLLTRPSQQTITANLADPNRLGTFLGFNSLALAIGGGLGNLGGGYLMDIALAYHVPWLPWLVFGTAGLLTAAALAFVLFPADELRRETHLS